MYFVRRMFGKYAIATVDLTKTFIGQRCPEEGRIIGQRCPKEDMIIGQRCPEEGRIIGQRCPKEDMNKNKKFIVDPIQIKFT